MKPSEIRDKTDDELNQLETELRDKLLRLSIAKATQRARNTAQFGRLRKDIARVMTIRQERQLGLVEGEPFPMSPMSEDESAAGAAAEEGNA